MGHLVNLALKHLMNDTDTQATMAKGIGISQPSISQYITGDSVPNTEALERILYYYDC